MARIMWRLGEDGFTAQELVVVFALFAAIIIPSLLFIHPKNYDVQDRNATRMVAVVQIMQDVHAYVAANGSLPSDIPTKMEPIGTAADQVNLCKGLTLTYMKTLPVDPFFGSSINCATTSTYETGLAIVRTGHGTKVTIASLGSEGKLVYITD
jgi:hypothetical protein